MASDHWGKWSELLECMVSELACTNRPLDIVTTTTIFDTRENHPLHYAVRHIARSEGVHQCGGVSYRTIWNCSWGNRWISDTPLGVIDQTPAYEMNTQNELQTTKKLRSFKDLTRWDELWPEDRLARDDIGAILPALELTQDEQIDISTDGTRTSNWFNRTYIDSQNLKQ